MSKKGENIRKRRDGRWEARYEKTRTAEGHIRYGYLYGKTYQEVRQKKLTILQNRILSESTRKIQENNISVTALCEKWQASTRHTIKESSFACYNTLLETHVIPWFSRYDLSQLSSELLDKFTIEMNHSGLSPRTIKEILILLKNILKYGEQMGYLCLNHVQISYPKTSSQTIKILSASHIRKLTEILLSSQTCFSTGILLCVYTGIRVGELSGLQWKDFDFSQEVFYIRRTVSRIKNLDYSKENNQPKTLLVTSTPKSASSARVIPIPDCLVNRLKMQCGSEDAYLLTGTTHCMEPRNIQRRFQTMLKKAIFQALTFMHFVMHLQPVVQKSALISRLYLKFLDIRPQKSQWIFMYTAVSDKRRNI